MLRLPVLHILVASLLVAIPSSTQAEKLPVPTGEPRQLPESGPAPVRLQGPGEIQVHIFGMVPGAAARESQANRAASSRQGAAGEGGGAPGDGTGAAVPAFGPAPGLAAAQRAPAVPLISVPLPSEASQVALTFNGLPAPADLPAFLAALRSAGARATVFAYGSEMEARPEVVASLLAAGHELGVRGYRRRESVSPRGLVGGLGGAEVAAELKAAVQALVRVGGPPPRFFRPPHGRYDEPLLAAAQRVGLEPVLWSSIGLRDQSSVPAPRLAEQARRAAFPGAVLMLHANRSPTVRALPVVLSRLRQEGYRLVTLSELVNAAGG